MPSRPTNRLIDSEKREFRLTDAFDIVLSSTKSHDSRVAFFSRAVSSTIQGQQFIQRVRDLCSGCVGLETFDLGG